MTTANGAVEGSAPHYFKFPVFRKYKLGWVATWTCRRCRQTKVDTRINGTISRGWIGEICEAL